MTDEQIIKALECCIKQEVNCKQCSYEAYRHKDCTDRFYADIIELIDRQKAEIERLQKEARRFADIGKFYSEIKVAIN